MTDPLIRFAVVSDGHINWDAGNESQHNTAASTISDWHNTEPLDFLVYNGDMHQDTEALDTIHAEFFDLLPSDLDRYVSYGNHEYVDPDVWPDEFGHETWHSFTVPHDAGGEFGVLIVQSATAASDGHDFSTTSSCPNELNPGWIENELDAMEANGVDGVFVFCHVSPDGDHQSSNECPDTKTQFQRDIVKIVFCGHWHTENGERIKDGIRYHFTNHLGDRGDGVEGIRLVEVKQ